MAGHKFDPSRAEVLNDPERLRMLPPDALWKALDVDAPRVLVDIGAGSGLLTKAFARLAPQAQVHAVDVSPEMLAFLDRHMDDDVRGRITPLLADERRVPLPDCVADAVTMIALYHELDDPKDTLRDVFRLLVPGGRMLIVDWAKEHADVGPSFEHRVDGTEISAAVQRAGFAAVELGSLPGFSVVTATRPPE